MIWRNWFASGRRRIEPRAYDASPMTEQANSRDQFDPVAILSERFRAAISEALPEAGDDAAALITAARNPAFGDFQSNAAMGLAKRLGAKPRELAAKIVAATKIDDIAEPLTEESIAGPGFINIRLKPDTLAGLLAALDTPDLGLPAPDQPETVVVDLCGVNLAKQMHVGHLRSTVIGDALARVIERTGAKVIRQNHVGDWGLPIAMVVTKLMQEAEAGRIDLDAITLTQLDALYKAAQRECSPPRHALAMVERHNLGPKADAEIRTQVEEAEEHLIAAKQTLVRLQAQDADVVAVWRRIYDVTIAACLANCATLHTKVDVSASAGESSYADELAGVVDDLESRAVAEESDGALVVRVEGVSEPCIVRKRDGGFLYATTDLAAIRRRVRDLGADRVIYAVDARQSLHFRQVFGAATRAGYAVRDGEPVRLDHAAFGTVLGEDNRPFKTRSGEAARLADLLEEAINRARAVVAEKNPSLPADERAKIGAAVGIAAIKYADLSSDRIKDYVFSFDRMLAFEGNTGPYLLYALVRVRSIFRKAQERGISAPTAASFDIAEPAEKALALALLAYPATVRAVADTLEPHRLCTYIYELATAFSSFFDQCPVLGADDESTRDARLRLCALTGRVLEDALNTLGLPTVERM